MTHIDRLRAASRGRITIDQVEELISWTGETIPQFWGRFGVHDSTWRRWKQAGAVPLNAGAHVLAWWALRWAEAEAAFAMAAAGDTHGFSGWPPQFDLPAA